MLFQKMSPLLIAAAASLPFAMADTCSVEARVTNSFAGSSEALSIFLGDGTKLKYDKNEGICDTVELVTGEGGNMQGDGSLDHKVTIKTECDSGTVKSCSASYDTQEDIEGGLGDKLGQNYHMCTVTFDC